MSRKKKTKDPFDNLMDAVRSLTDKDSFFPATVTEIREAVSLPKTASTLLRQVLKELVNRRVLVQKKGRYSPWIDSSNTILGTLRMNPRGFGFVIPDDPTASEADVFIPPHATLSAVDGDKVEVRIVHGGRSDKGPEGVLTAIVERARSHIGGIVSFIDHGNPYVYSPLLGKDNLIELVLPEGEKLCFGDRIVAEVIEWGEKDRSPKARLTHHIGHINDPSVDIAAAVEEYGLHDRFSTSVIEEAEKLSLTISQAEIDKRHDFRQMECFTIDPDTAKDFDDALSLEKDSQEYYHLTVHIADVTHFVQPLSALDEEAKLRCNSTYFPGRCIPMLPERLSNDLCSLKPNVNRLTVSVMMTFDKGGALVDHKVVRGVIRSQKRFTYTEAKEVLDGKRRSKHKKKLELMVELCQLLKKQRYNRGSIEFALPSSVIIIGEGGMPVEMVKEEYDITHQMVEEFMLKANEVVARSLSDDNKPLTFRIHEQPADESLKEFAGLAQTFGFDLPEKPEARDLQNLFEEALKSPYGQHLAVNYIRRMKLAYYSPHNIGHYGLSLEHYCHFTSPIRRYVDIVAHRAILGGNHDLARLEEVADRCSQQERLSARAENDVTLLKKLRLLQAIREKNPNRQYEAVVTRIKPFGVVFEVTEFMVDGFLHVADIGADYFYFNDQKQLLEGDRTGMIFTATDTIILQLSGVDLVAMECRWNFVGKKNQKKKKRRR